MAAVTHLETVRPPATDEPNIECFEEKARFCGGVVTYETFISPNADPETADFVVPGYLGVQPSYEKFGQSVAENNRNAIVIKPVRTQSPVKAFHPVHLFKPLRLPGQSLRAAMADSREKYGFRKFNMLSHSMGGPVTMQLLNAHVDYIESVLLIGSAGLDRHSIASLGLRLPGVALEVLPTIPRLEVDRSRTAKHVMRYVMDNPMRTVTEGLAVAKSDIHPYIKKARANGISIGRLQFKADPFFPIDKITDLDKQSVDLYQEFADPKAGHLAILLQPKAVANMSSLMIEQMLQSTQLNAG